MYFSTYSASRMLRNPPSPIFVRVATWAINTSEALPRYFSGEVDMLKLNCGPLLWYSLCFSPLTFPHLPLSSYFSLGMQRQSKTEYCLVWLGCCRRHLVAFWVLSANYILIKKYTSLFIIPQIIKYKSFHKMTLKQIRIF